MPEENSKIGSGEWRCLRRYFWSNANLTSLPLIVHKLSALTRRIVMKRWLVGSFVLLTLSVYAQQSVPTIPFDSVTDVLKLPKDLHLGEVTGVAVNSKGHVFVFSRGSTTGPAYAASAAQLLEFGPDGNFIREVGKNLYA